MFTFRYAVPAWQWVTLRVARAAGGTGNVRGVRSSFVGVPPGNAAVPAMAA